MNTKKLLICQAWQAEFSSGFYFVIFYTLDKKNRKVDSLTCRPNDFLADDHDD